LRKNGIQDWLMNKKIKIGLDLDGVIIDHTLNKIRLAKQCGYFLKTQQTSSEIVEKIVPPDIKRFIQKGIYGQVGLSSGPMKNSKKMLKKITETFSVPYIISRRDYKHNQRKFALEWLKNNHFFPPLKRNRILFAKSEPSKNNVCKKLNINIYLDDKIEVLNNLRSVKYKVLFDPYCHRYKNPPKNIKVVKTWLEFYKYLQ